MRLVGLLLLTLAALPTSGALAQTEPPTKPLPAAAIGTILGRAVLDPDGNNVGRLVNLFVSLRGEPLAAVIDVGGFMGVGMRRVAVDWPLLRFTTDQGEVRVEVAISMDDLAAAPELRGLMTDRVVVGGHPK